MRLLSALLLRAGEGSMVDANFVDPQFNAFLARNRGIVFTPDALADAAFADRLNWDGEDRDAIMTTLRQIARLAPVESDPERAQALLLSGYQSPFQIARQHTEAFVEQLEPRIGAEAAWSIHRQADAAQSRTVHRLMQVREALSPTQRAVQGRSPAAVAPTSTTTPALGRKVNYAAIFGDALNSDIPHDASILGPGAYFADLMRVVERYIPNAFTPGVLSLASRRPDLRNLLLTPANATEEISNADLILEILESTLMAASLDPPPRLEPSSPQGAPDLVQVVSGWPAAFKPGTTYIIDSAGNDPIIVSSSVGIEGAVTIRSARGMQRIALDKSPIPIRADGGKMIVLEGFSFTADPAAPIFTFSSGAILLRNCVLSTKDEKTGDGWAIACRPRDPGGAPASGTILLENCTIADMSGSSPHRAIDAGDSGALTLSLRSSILFSKNGPTAEHGLVRGGRSTAISLDDCDVSGGRLAIETTKAAASAVAYRGSNFDADPDFDADNDFRLRPSSPCIGRGADGGSVGASRDIYDVLRWAVHPFDFPFDPDLESARLALAALDVDLEDIAVACSEWLGRSSGPYFALSQLGLSLADYLVLRQWRSGGLEPYFGRSKPFAEESVKIAPDINPLLFPAADFARWIGCAPDELRELIYQDLSASEIAAGVQAGGQVAGHSQWRGFFVNGYGNTAEAPAMALALSTQYVPVGRYALSFAASTRVCVRIPALPPVPPGLGSFTISFWMFQLLPQSATVLSIGAGVLSWTLDNAELTVGSISRPRANVIDLSDAVLLAAKFTSMPQWVHIATVFDPKTGLTTYVNGVAAATAPVPVISFAGAPVTLGASAAQERFFTGSVCELVICNRALGESELLEGFQKPGLAQDKATPLLAARR
jgi:hypothetical protein